MTPEEDIRRADQAKSILDHDLVKEAFAGIEAELLVKWDATPVRDTEGRERLWMMRQMLLRFRDHFTSMVESGELAKGRIVQMDKERKLNLWRRAV